MSSARCTATSSMLRKCIPTLRTSWTSTQSRGVQHGQQGGMLQCWHAFGRANVIFAHTCTIRCFSPRCDSTFNLATAEDLAAGVARVQKMKDESTLTEWHIKKEKDCHETGQTITVFAEKMRTDDGSGDGAESGRTFGLRRKSTSNSTQTNTPCSVSENEVNSCASRVLLVCF
jgi:hypothetical protein